MEDDGMADVAGFPGRAGRIVVLALASCGWVAAPISTLVEVPHIIWPGSVLFLVGGALLAREWGRVWHREAPYDVQRRVPELPN
jgi:hypothetical protein